MTPDAKFLIQNILDLFKKQVLYRGICGGYDFFINSLYINTTFTDFLTICLNKLSVYLLTVLSEEDLHNTSLRLFYSYIS